MTDTMKDIIVDTIGAFLASCIGYFAVKHEKGWLTADLMDEEETAKAAEKKKTKQN